MHRDRESGGRVYTPNNWTFSVFQSNKGWFCLHFTPFLREFLANTFLQPPILSPSRGHCMCRNFYVYMCIYFIEYVFEINIHWFEYNFECDIDDIKWNGLKWASQVERYGIRRQSFKTVYSVVYDRLHTIYAPYTTVFLRITWSRITFVYLRDPIRRTYTKTLYGALTGWNETIK